MLVARGDAVRAFGRHEYPALTRLGVDCRRGDVRDFEAVRAACAGVDLVFHTAAKAGVWGNRAEFFEINAKGTATVLRACLEAHVTRLVHTSSPSVVFERDSIEAGDESLPYPKRFLAAYPASKASAEQMVLAANEWEMVVETTAGNGSAAERLSRIERLRTCALRPHLIWGPGDPHLIPRVVRAARQGALRRVGDGTNKVDLTYVDNAAEAHLRAADELCGAGRCAGKAYFIGDAEPVALWPWLNELLRRLDVPPVTHGMPLRAAYALGACLEAVHGVFPKLGEPRLTRFVVLQLGRSHFFSHERARQDFGYSPMVDNATGMQRLVDWLKNTEDAG